MGQGLIGGATSYEGQSIKDILSDINRWVEYTNDTLSSMEQGIIKLERSGFWNNVPFNFQMTLLSTATCQRTYLDDFDIIKESIKADNITQKYVRLLRKIGKNAIEFNHEYGRTYKEDYTWKKYGDPNFKIAEDLYANGRDFFVTLQDASNASARLEDYVTTLAPLATHNITQNITGNMNVVTGVNEGDINVVNNNFKEFFEESKEAIKIIDKLEKIDSDTKGYIKDLLIETADAIKQDDSERQKECKSDYKGFFIAAGVKAYKAIGGLSNFASIASFFGITL